MNANVLQIDQFDEPGEHSLLNNSIVLWDDRLIHKPVNSKINHKREYVRISVCFLPSVISLIRC